MPATIISIKHVFKDFGSVRAVNDANFEIAEGEFFSLLGPSGCGKTTLLRMLAGFEVPTQGSIHIDGKDVTLVPPNHRPVNMVFQNYAIFPHLNVASNIAFGMRKSGLSKRQLADRIEEMLELIRLPGYGERTAMELSGGQRQRVALARALIKQPKVLLLDEPLGALDKKLREQMQIELRQLQQQVGITFVFVTHDQEEALTLSDRIAVMAQGDVLEISTPGELYEAPGSRFVVADFIGTMNFFDCTLSECRSGMAIAESAELGRVRAACETPPVAPGEGFVPRHSPGEVSARLRRCRSDRKRRQGSDGALCVSRGPQPLLCVSGGPGRAGIHGAAEPGEVPRSDQWRGPGGMADLVGRCGGAAAERGTGRDEARSVLRLRDIKSGVLFRLTVSLVILHGCAHVSSEEADGGYKEYDSRECPSVPEFAGQVPELKGVVKVVESDDEKVEGCGKDPGLSVKGYGKATALVDEGAGEVVDEAGEVVGRVGECVGTRFKKCR